MEKSYDKVVSTTGLWMTGKPEYNRSIKAVAFREAKIAIELSFANSVCGLDANAGKGNDFLYLSRMGGGAAGEKTYMVVME